MKITHPKQVQLWLVAMCIAIVCLVMIGGITRLTDAGLSITEWKPMDGILPPLNHEAWSLEFDKYKLSPEYIKINNHMDLASFKVIFWTEFIHRLAARITGLLYLVPFLYFLLTGKIKHRDRMIYFGGLILLGLQGFAGWYMVKSGLVSDPHVSHFRLAIHLMLAVLLYAILFWQLMKLSVVISNEAWIASSLTDSTTKQLAITNKLINFSLLTLFCQITLGAFVAGLDAGLVYNDFPLMGGSFVPLEITINSLSLISFSDPVFVQFLHRIFAYILTMLVVAVAIYGFKLKYSALSRALIYSLIALALQITIGIATLIYQVPVIIALFHQLGAILLMSSLLYIKYLLWKL